MSGTGNNSVDEKSPVKVTWDIKKFGRYLVVQVHKNRSKTPIWPSPNYHAPSKSGVEIKLSPGVYEIKVWISGKMTNVSTWIAIE